MMSANQALFLTALSGYLRWEPRIVTLSTRTARPGSVLVDP